MQIDIISFTEKGGKLAQAVKQNLEKASYRETSEKISQAIEENLEKYQEYNSENAKAVQNPGFHTIEAQNERSIKKYEGSEIWKKNGETKIHLADGRNLKQPLKQWCQKAFNRSELLIFVGAAGIAVRTIAPFVKDKFTDPAVLVIDEKGRFVIPVLSGHAGGANQWAQILAEALSAIPVITTATDINGRFAVDVFAVRNHLSISDRILAKKISSAILRGSQIDFICEKNIKGELPKELIWTPVSDMETSENDTIQQKKNVAGTEIALQQGKFLTVAENPAKQKESDDLCRIFVGIHNFHQEQTLYLHPKAVTIGIGCKKGKSLEEIEAFVLEILTEQQIAMESICCAASVDKKKEEQGILAFCEKYHLPYMTFSPEQLAETPGSYTESGFVKDTIGVGNVCERAAVRAAMIQKVEYCPGSKEQSMEKMKKTEGRLILPKTAKDGITLSLAEKEWSVVFE